MFIVANGFAKLKYHLSKSTNINPANICSYMIKLMIKTENEKE